MGDVVLAGRGSRTGGSTWRVDRGSAGLTLSALLTGLLLVPQVPAAAAPTAVVLPPSGAEPFSIGNRIWIDDGADGAGGFNLSQRDNGVQDSGERGVNGVRVELYVDADGNGVADADEFVRFDVTAAGLAGAGRPGSDLNGYYLFDDLPAGTYFVVVPASEFAVGRPLGGHHSSRFDGTATLGAPGAVGTPATDLDDNGIEPANRRPDMSGVVSSPVTFVDGGTVVTGESDLSLEGDPGAPANQVGSIDPTGWDGPGSIGRRTTGGQRDDASNVAVDFGFTPPMSIGNRIWLDDSSDPAQWASGGSRDNALVDGTDDGNLLAPGLQNPGVANVPVQLYVDVNNSATVDAGDTLVATTTSNATGYYLFDGLAAGNYLVRIPSSAFGAGQPLNGLVSSFDAVAQANPANQTDSNDNGVDEAAPVINGVTTRQVRLIPFAAQTGENDPAPQVQQSRGRFGETDSDSNLTIDFGFTRPPTSIGDRVWLDDHPTDQALRNNGLRNAGEPALPGVEVALYRDLDSDGSVDAGEDTGLRSTTDVNGSYRFDNLPGGSYLVAITEANFNAGGPLENSISSRSVAPNPTAADNQVDDNDNGRDAFVAGVGVISSSIVLAYGLEPTTETSTGPIGTHGERNSDSDLSVDFGFYVPMSLGNRVWLDDSAAPAAVGTTRDNARIDVAADDLDNPNIAGVQGLGVAGVTMRLYRDLDGDGMIDAGEDSGRTTTTNATGYYVFDGLPRGAYLVGVEPSSFNAGAPLNGFRSSTNPTAPTDDDVDSADKGTWLAAAPTTPSPTYGVLSPTIVLGYGSATSGSEPTGETDPTPQTQANRGSNGERDAFSNLTVDFGFVRSNTAPTAVNDSYSTPFGTTRTVSAPGVLGNDTDLEGNTLTAQVVANPAHGTLALASDGSFVYTPSAGYAGADSFTYRARDAALSSAPATVSITVDANEAPTADDDSYSTPFETATTVTAPGVLDGDVDPEGRPLNAMLATAPAKGDVTLSGNGSFTYTPYAGETGVDTFTYRADDGYAASDAATVTITIGADPNQAPTAVDDSYATPFGTTRTVPAPGVLGNDTDPDDDALTVSVVDGPTHGTLTLDGDGSFTYTPDAGYDGPDAFTYRATDGKLSSNTATVSLTVEPDLVPPSVTFDAPAGPITGPVEVTLTFSEPVTGLSEGDFEVSGATLGELSGSQTTYELVLTPTVSGTITLELPADSVDDAAGNGNLAASLTRVADIDAPGVQLSAPLGPVNGPITVTATFTEQVSGLVASEISVSGGAASDLASADGGTTWTFEVTATADGPVTVQVPQDVAQDAAGNPNTASTPITRTIDTVRPSVLLTAPTGPRNEPFEVVVTFSEPVLGLVATDLVVVNGTATDLTEQSATEYALLVTPGAQGPVTMRLPVDAVADPAGNGNTASTDLVRTFDSVSPTVQLDAPAGPVNGPFTVSITLSEAAGTLAADDLEVVGGTAADLRGAGTSYAVDVTPTTDGTVRLSVVDDAVTDAAGNSSAATSLTRVADLTAPMAELSTAAPDPTNAAAITVDIAFSEPVSGLDVDDLTVTGGTLSALTGSGSTYAATLTFDPAGDGARIGLPAAAATDAAGNPSRPATDLSRAYDRTAPVLTVTRAPGQPDPVLGGRVVFAVTADEPVTDLDPADVTLAGAAGATSVTVRRTGPTTYEVAATGMSVTGDVDLSLAAGAVADTAGNPSAAAGPFAIAWARTEPPRIGVLFDNRCLAGGLAGTIGLRLPSTAATTLTATSSDPGVVPPPSVVITGRGDDDRRALITVRPRTGRSGTATVTITATNVSGTDSRTFRVVVGTNGPDRIEGTARPDLVFAKAGADIVRGGGERDLVCGGAGDDRLYGGDGRDALYGQAGDDRLVGGGLSDTLVGGPGRDTVVGGPGDNDITPRRPRG